MQRAARTFVVLLLVGLILPVDTPAAQTSASCHGARARTTHSNLQQIERATLCLINVQRRAQGLPVLRSDHLLRLAAVGHSREMVVKRYFAHTSAGGGRFIARIRRTGYLARSRFWRAGENIAWGVGALSTPASIVRAWMNSPPHRHNILTRGFRDIGIGIVRGSPRIGGRGATYTTDFGSRS